MLRNLYRRLSVKWILLVPMILFLVLTLSQVGLIYQMNSVQRADAATVNVAGRQRALSQRMAKESFALMNWQGVSQKAALAETVKIFDSSMQALLNGGASMVGGKAISIKKTDDQQILSQLQEAQNFWVENKPLFQSVLDGQTKDPEKSATLINQASLGLFQRFDKITAMYETASAGTVDRNVRLIYACLAAYILIIIINRFVVGNKILKPVLELQQAASRISSGDLSGHEVAARGSSEIDSLTNAFGGMSGSLKEIIGQLAQDSQKVASAAMQLTSSAQQTSAGANETATTINQIAGTLDQVNLNTREISQFSGENSRLADLGGEKIQDLYNQMDRIAETNKDVSGAIGGLVHRAEEISRIVELITSIADQTNLLALNAAIESARAGEQGRGFSVVAEEVRKLADHSTQAAKNINELVVSIKNDTNRTMEIMSESSREVEAGVTTVEDIRDSLRQIIKNTQTLNDHLKNIATSLNEVSSGTQNVAAATEEQTAAMEEVSASAEALAGLADGLMRISERFKV